jgi:hypothetical protein
MCAGGLALGDASAVNEYGQWEKRGNQARLYQTAYTSPPRALPGLPAVLNLML